MRCPSCCKFVSLEMQDPEVEVDMTPPEVDEEVPTDGGPPPEPPEFTISGSVRIVRVCAECSDELKEASLDVDVTVAWGETPEGTERIDVDAIAPLLARIEEAELEEGSIDPVEEGGGRYAKSYYGASVVWDITIDGTVVARAEWSDKVAASGMDEMV